MMFSFKKGKSKKLLALGVVALTLGTILLGGCGSEKQDAASNEPVKVKVAWSPSACGAPIFAAYENGYFKDEGLDVEMIQVDAAHVSEAVGAGQVDVLNGLVSKMIKPMENGLAVQATTGLHRGCIKLLTKSDSDINTIADLKGKKIGVAGMADAGTIIARRALHYAGIDATEKTADVEFAVYSRNDLAQALETDKVDAIAVGDPQATITAQEYGYRVLLDTSKDKPFGDEYCCDLFISTRLVKEDPATAAKVTRAVQRASQWVQDNPDAAAQLEVDKKYVAGDPALIASMLKSYDYTPSVQGGHDAVLAAVRSLVEIGFMKDGTDADRFTEEHTAFFENFPDAP